MIGRTNANAGNTAENLNISLKTNQDIHEDLIGAIITIKYSDVEEQYTWQGDDLLIQIPRYAKYTVTFGSVEGYKTPDSFSSTAQEKNSVSLEAIYETELVTVNVEGAEGYEISINEISMYNNEYTEVEYIESTGTQYIDTGFKHNQDTRVVMKVQATSITANAWAFEGRNSSSSAKKGVFYYYSSNDLWNVDYPGSRQSISNISDTDLLEIDYNKNVCTINGQSVTHTATTFQSSYNLTLLACNTAGTISGKLKAKLYSCQIYDNDVLIRDYVPVKNSQGIYGLYDKVNNTFSVSAGSDQFVGSEVVYKKNIATQTSSTGTHKIPYDTEYAIEASNVDGCTTPEIQMFTASQITRSVDIVYTEAVENVTVNVSTEDGADVDGQAVIVETRVPSEGVYIEDINNKLWKTDDWDGSIAANGVAVITSKSQFVISLEQNSTQMRVNADDTGPYDGYLAGLDSEDSARNDYNGYVNTSNMMIVESSPLLAAGFCKAYLFPSGENGFLPSAGQLSEAFNNKNAIESALMKVGGDEFISYGYWSSTYRGYNSLGMHSFYILDFDTGDLIPENTINPLYVRPFKNIGHKSYSITNGKASFSVPYDETYTVSVDDMDGYTTPASQTYTASQPSRTISMEYTKAVEHVVVTVVDENGAFANNQIITVTGDVTGSHTIMNSRMEFDVPIGLTYTVSVNDKDGYITPESQTFTAEAGTRTVRMVYEAVTLGVFIQGVSGKLYETDAWTNQETPNGVAVITEECSFVIALDKASSTMCIHNNTSGALENYMTAIKDETQAKADYDGATNTTNIMKLQSGTNYAAGWCNAFSFPSGKKGFLPSLGQIYAVYNNKDDVNVALSKAGGTEFFNTSYWTSTFYGAGATARYCWRFDWTNGSPYSRQLSYYHYVRAFTTLNNSSSSEEGGETNSVSIVWSTISGTWNSNSNSSAADGVSYTCESPGADGSTVIRCTFSGISSITFNCVYNGESNYDYLTVGAIDSSCTRSTYGTSLKGKSGTAQDITYNCTTDTHYVEFCYSKDSSVDTDPDNATVYITTYS